MNLELNSDNIINALLSQGLVLVKKADLEEMINNVNISNTIDRRKKYVSHKEIIKMFGVTDYWLKKQREAAGTKIKCIPGENKNSAWTYQIGSIEDEQERLAV
ncbi:hypothetical protein SAMN04489761_4643 [Tenacibaculum sp. MAR_2009_124]|uniref:hypothetical protein n=1 Tax=Tenacibaculum sp. MAR_2009_124 TaxID=1250059 RepID=UPI000895C6D3|nr:hypothetical protein [Tenacibaculum sp. MAR_2009_124]SED21324.1 hypothetical protein SAMN04489761_4643 [Tenacibaculum sp. MAR_2009_124]